MTVYNEAVVSNADPTFAVPVEAGELLIEEIEEEGCAHTSLQGSTLCLNGGAVCVIALN